MPDFDQYGNLTPYDIISICLDEFKKHFLFSKRREEIFTGYQRYCDDLLQIVPSMCHWIDGSFVTAKENPSDIDVVCFISHVHFNELVLQFDMNIGNQRSKIAYGVDSYIVFEFPKNDPRYKNYYLERLEYWSKWFGYDRNGRKKGIVELRYG